MYDVVYSPSALKTLEKIDKIQQERLLSTISRLRIRPDSLDIKKLVGMAGYRLRVGDYRVIFDMDSNDLRILVLRIGHRKDVYD